MNSIYRHKASHYLHPDTRSEDNLYLVEQELSKTLDEREPNPLFDKKSLMEVPGHEWMKTVDMVLVTKDNYPSLVEDFFPYFKSLLNPVHERFLNKKTEEPLKVCAVDLETTGLAKTIQIIGGVPTIPNSIVGICVAGSSSKGFYIPVLHNETDNIKNYEIYDALEFLTKIQEFICVYHNASYDREVLETQGIPLRRDYIDTLQLALNMFTDVFKFRAGLKNVSELFLSRKMIEYKSLSGDKNMPPLTQFPASDLTCYGCSDAVNTFGIYEYIFNHERNPYKVNKFAMRLDSIASDCTRWMLRYGMPVDYGNLSKSLRTLVRRKFLLENLFRDTVSDTVKISSSEQVGICIGEVLQKYYSKSKEGTFVDDSLLFEDFQRKMLSSFNMEVKQVTLKSGTVKTKFSSGDKVLTVLRSLSTELHPWLDEETCDWLRGVGELLELYRSVELSIAFQRGMYRHAYTDDLNLDRVSINLKINGTITNRFSNKSGSGPTDRFKIIKGVRKNKVLYAQGDSAASFNSQGVLGARLDLKKAKRVVKMPPEVLKQKEVLDGQVEAFIREVMLLSM